MGPADELVPVLKRLRMSGVLESLDVRNREAVDAGLSHQEFLLRLLQDEVQRRDAKQTTARLRRANFDHRKTLEDFDFQFNPSLPKWTLRPAPSSPAMSACCWSAQLGRERAI